MDASSIVSAVAILCFAALIFSAAVSDILTFMIPNRVCLTVALLYPAYVVSAGQPVPWLLALAIASGILAAGFVLYSLGACGAGDAKLFAAAALWAGPGLVLPFTIMTTLAGGVVAIFLYLQHRLARAPALRMALQTDVDPDFKRQLMPYGAAIAVGGLYVAFTLLRVN